MINAFWVALEGFGIRPDRILVLAHARHKQTVSRVLPSLKIVAKGFGVNVEPELQVVPEEDLKQALAKIAQVFKDARGQGEVVLDITPARKNLASVAMRAAQTEGVSKILYLHLKRMEAGDMPYPLIAMTLHQSCDLGTLQP